VILFPDDNLAIEVLRSLCTLSRELRAFIAATFVFIVGMIPLFSITFLSYLALY